MIMVERAVRPVRAGGARKLRMRQELLAHLTERFEAERARLGDDAAALDETTRRFGDPAEVTRELQSVVPVYERILSTPIPGLHQLERRALWGARRWRFSATSVAALGAGVTFLAFLPLYAARLSELRDWARITLFLGGIAVQIGGAFLVNYLLFRLCASTITSGWRETARSMLSYGAAIVVVQVLAAQVLYSYVFGEHDSGLTRLPQVVMATVLFVVVTPLMIRFVASRWRRSNEWLSLEIGP
jgi:hypothetical protein